MAQQRDSPPTRASAAPAPTVGGRGGTAPRRARRAPRRRGRSAVGLGLALLAAATVLLAANRGVAPGGTSAWSDLDDLFAHNPALQQLEQAGSFREPNLSRTADGHTVTLRRAYAGGGRIVLVYTVGRPPDVPASAVAPEPRLTDGVGRAFGPLVGAGAGTAEATYFDAPAARDGPAALDLHLEITLRGPGPDRRPLGVPFVFDFGVPVAPDPTEDVAIGQTVEAAGVAVTLRQVTLGRSGSPAIICFAPPDSALPGWSLAADLDGAPSGGSGQAIAGAGTCARYRFADSPPPAAPDAHTLTVRELLGFGPGAPTRLVGPWVFHFTAP